MSNGREIRSYDYVNRPYERVRDALNHGRGHYIREKRQECEKFGGFR
jgi:hypothetical protein